MWSLCAPYLADVIELNDKVANIPFVIPQAQFEKTSEAKQKKRKKVTFFGFSKKRKKRKKRKSNNMYCGPKVLGLNTTLNQILSYTQLLMPYIL